MGAPRPCPAAGKMTKLLASREKLGAGEQVIVDDAGQVSVVAMADGGAVAEAIGGRQAGGAHNDACAGGRLDCQGAVVRRERDFYRDRSRRSTIWP